MPPRTNKAKASGTKKSSAPTKKIPTQKAPVKAKNTRKRKAAEESSDDNDSGDLSEAQTRLKQRPHKKKKCIELHKDEQSDPEPEVIEEESDDVEDGGAARKDDEVSGNIFRYNLCTYR
jgi:hypothetical protein